MRLKLCLILIFLFSFCGTCIKSNSALDDLNFDNIIYQIEDDFKFEENGVRAIYRNNKTIYENVDYIKKQIKKEFDADVELYNNKINLRTSLGDIEVNFISDNEDTIVYLTIINYNREITISKLMKELTKLQGKNTSEVQYFRYIKGKINNIEERLGKIKELHQINKIDTLEIHNGYVGTAKLSDGTRVNIALNSYDTGNYLIIGTPVIFTTY